MGFLAPLAALLGLEVSGVVTRAKSAAIIYGLMAIFMLGAVVFLIAAGYMALADIFSPIIAALIFAGVFLLLALGVYLGTLIGRSNREKQAMEKRRSSETGALLTTAAMTALPLLARSPLVLKLGVPAAIVAAFALLRDRNQG